MPNCPACPLIVKATLIIHALCFAAEVSAADVGQMQLPERGICAHRGASDTHPENTLAAFDEAVRLGAHMVEFDVARTKDHRLVLMHDETVDRTTSGSGYVRHLTLGELSKLDAGSWKHEKFTGEPVPTLIQVLDIMPENIWLNVHLKGDPQLAAQVAREITDAGRLHQAFLACGRESAAAAHVVEPQILICNMDRAASSKDYVDETIDLRADFIQFLGRRPVALDRISDLKQHGIRVNYCCVNDAALLPRLWEAGVEFPLVDRAADMLEAAESYGVERTEPIYRHRH